MNKNQQTIEALLKDGHDVDFLDKDGDRCIIFKKIGNVFFGACLKNYSNVCCQTYDIKNSSIRNFTNIKIYKEETNEEKIKRLLKDGKVKAKQPDGYDIVILEFYNHTFFGRYKILNKPEWGSGCWNTQVPEFTNITLYTND